MTVPSTVAVRKMTAVPSTTECHQAECHHCARLNAIRTAAHCARSRLSLFFASPSPGYPFRVLNDAKAACAGIGARLATWAELTAAHAAGAEWCACGATGDNSWSYPMQVGRNGPNYHLQHIFSADMSESSHLSRLSYLTQSCSFEKRVSMIPALRLRRNAPGGPRVRWRWRKLLRNQAERGPHARGAPLCPRQVPRARRDSAPHPEGRALLLQPWRHEV